jgi:nicotinamide-nucleotide amidase
MPSAEIITIGTEILLGEIVDTNSAYLARKLRDLNVDVFRTSTVGDNAERIAGIITETLARAQIIITTGGLGPTVDDPTREAVARAFGVPVEYHLELWEQVVERMQRFGRTPTENQKRQAYIPQGALAIKNPVGTAPAFLVEQKDRVVISLPGVPREMEYIAEHSVFPYLRKRYDLRGMIKARVLHTSGIGESQIDEWVGDLELLTNPTVGLAAHAGRVDIRITAKAESEEQADALIAEVEREIRTRVGSALYGVDEETLEGATLARLQALDWRLATLEINLGGALTGRLAKTASGAYAGGEALTELPHGETLLAHVRAERAKRGVACMLGLQLIHGEGQSDLHIALITPRGEDEQTRTYGGHARNAPQWACNMALDLLCQRAEGR